MCECLKRADGTWHVDECCAWLMDNWHGKGLEAYEAGWKAACEECAKACSTEKDILQELHEREIKTEQGTIYCEGASTGAKICAALCNALGERGSKQEPQTDASNYF
jgi:hypothetical protein